MATKKPVQKTTKQDKELTEKDYKAFQQKKGMPAGFIVLTIFYIIVLISSIMGLFAYQEATGIFFGFSVSGTAVLMITIINVLVFGLLLYGIFKRIDWSRDLAMAYFGIMILDYVVSIIQYIINPDKIIDIMMRNVPAEALAQGESMIRNTLGITTLITWIISIIIYAAIFVYYYKKTKYFGTEK